MLNKDQLNRLTLAIQKLEEAKDLVRGALGDSDSADISIHAINDAIDDLRYDLDEVSVDE